MRWDNLRIWDISDLALPSAEGTPAPMGQCRIAYQGDADIYVRNCDGSGVRRLTDHPADDGYPAWSPDGRRIVFQSDRDIPPGSNGSLYIMDADGSGLTRLTFDYDDWLASWSPDGNRIAFHSSCGLRLIAPDGSNLREIPLEGEVSCDYPMWSPDGQQLAFTSWQPEPDRTVYVVNADGTELLKLARFPAGDAIAVWSPDGQQIGVACRDEEGTPRYYMLNADGSGEPEEVSSIPDFWYPWYWPQWGRE